MNPAVPHPGGAGGHSHVKVLVAGISSLVLTLGVARFAYTPLLPVMQDQTALNDTLGGWIATFNYLGYMLGALVAASISDLRLKDGLYRAGLVVAVVTTLAMAWTENWILWSLLRFLAGLSSAAGLLIGSGLILNWLIRQGHQTELGVHFGGVGLGIAVSAVAVELMLEHLDWAEQWRMFALLGLALALPAWLWLPRPDRHNLTRTGELLVDNPPPKAWMRLLALSYFCAGVGYVISATFLVLIVERQPDLQGYGAWVWLVVGLAGIPACVFWDRVARRLGGLKALLLAYALQIVGIVLPAFDVSAGMVFVSAALYGGTFIGIVTLMLTMVGRFYPTRPAKPMGRLTLSYGAAQVIAPALAGSAAEISGSYAGSLIMAALVMLAGMIVLWILTGMRRHREPDTQDDPQPTASP
jgi:predicted MFS family arabinose efflux permease